MSYPEPNTDAALQFIRETAANLLTAEQPKLTAGQRQAFLTALEDTPRFRAAWQVSGPLVIANSDGVELRYAIKELATGKPELVRGVPSNNDVVRHLVEKEVSALGEMRRAEAMLTHARAVEGMSDDDKLATGAIASPPTQEIAKHDAPLTMANWSDGDERWNVEILKRWGKGSGQLLPSERARYIAEMRKEASRGQMHPKDAQELKRIGLKDEASLTPEERVTRARLMAHN